MINKDKEITNLVLEKIKWWKELQLKKVRKKILSFMDYINNFDVILHYYSLP